MSTVSTPLNDMLYPLPRRSSRVAMAILLTVGLSACSSGDSGGSGADDTAVAASVRPSVSAAQLVNDDTRTPGYAQSVVAGVIDVTDTVNPTPVSSTEGDDTATNGGVPLAAYAQPEPDTSADTDDNEPDTDATDTDSPDTSSPDTGSSDTGNPDPNTGNSDTTDTDTGTDSGDANGDSSDGDTGGGDTGDGDTAGGDSDNVDTSGGDTNGGTTSGGDTNGSDSGSADNDVDSEPADSSDSSTAGSEDPEPAAEPDVGEAVATAFSSHTTPGFAATVDENHAIEITWLADPTARGYNVYRDAEYITTVFEERYVDSDRYDGSYYYEIQAFDFADNFSWWATGLTVVIDGSGRIDPDAPATNEGLLDDYELVFSEEFQSNTLDTSVWNTSYLWGPDLVINSEEQYYVDIKNEPDWGYNPFEVDGEYLTIRSIPTPAELLDKANGQPYLSGVITSYDSLQFTYGYVEARAKVPYGQGFWSAFWLLNAYYVDDKPEIDIMEHIGDDQDVVYHTYHYYDSAGELRSSSSYPTPGIDYTGDFHTYAVEWKPGTIIYYVDGIERHRIVDPKVSSQDMYIIANTALGGWWPGSPDATTPFPAEYKIDYIRAYQKVGVYSDLPIFDDDTSAVPLADDVRGSSPNHMPPFELWPEGYPERL